MSGPETTTQYSTAETSSVAGGQLVGRSNKGAVASKEPFKLRLDLNLEVENAIQAKANGHITLCLLDTSRMQGIDVLGKTFAEFQAVVRAKTGSGQDFLG
ncbi:hypothetical protein EDD18DRAFT_1353169 [Armillaria luteobubalina]|uniref:Uncharacterized protein n=1 Tax=Armillaria luteobubalina TaxID=153913 RepID=A0AA39Q5B0_9AGAR|nr:hypothetical protein EDD18DRAFT_1353169 [Armillaria luteobubalina]